MNRHLIVAKKVSLELAKTTAILVAKMFFFTILTALGFVFPLPMFSSFIYKFIYKLIYGVDFAIAKEPNANSILYLIIVSIAAGLNLILYTDLVCNQKWKRIYKKIKNKILRYYEDADHEIELKMLAKAQSGDISIANQIEMRGSLEEKDG